MGTNMGMNIVEKGLCMAIGMGTGTGMGMGIRMGVGIRMGMGKGVDIGDKYRHSYDIAIRDECYARLRHPIVREGVGVLVSAKGGG